MAQFPSLPPTSGSAPPSKRPTHHLQVDLAGLDVDELLELRAQIDDRLPVKALKDLDLERELVLQLLASQRLQRDVLEDDETPANQRAQVSNSVAAILAQLVKLQAGVYTSERLKKIEQILIEVLNQLPEEQQDAFHQAYAKGLGVALG